MEWYRFKDIVPARGDKIVALYSDGSGSEIFWLSYDDDDTASNGEGSVEELEYLYKAYDRWAYLPDGFLFYGEDPPDESAANFMELTG